LPIHTLRVKIASALNIQPATRVEIESGKGTILEDLNRPLMSIIDESSIVIDPLDGHMILTVYVNITEEVLDPMDDLAAGIGSPRANAAVPFYQSLLSNRVDIKYSDSYYLTAKIPFAGSDAKAFNICSVEKFAAASPLPTNLTVKLHPWKEEDDDAKSSLSDSGAESKYSSGPPNIQRQNSPPKPFWRKKLHLPRVMKRSEPSQHVHNGDIVVLECDSKYVSVTRGWWLSWTSPTPRRSGAFMIEIIERAPQNKIIETFNKIRRPSIISSSYPTTITQTNLASAQVNPLNSPAYAMTANPLLSQSSNNPPAAAVASISGQGSSPDDVLYSGDTFRLRSVKFPDYEFGITNSRINEDHCYTGLRKIGSNTTNSDDWCIGVHFTLKPNTLGTQLTVGIKTAIPFDTR
jgi:hypothetical protein